MLLLPKNNPTMILISILSAEFYDNFNIIHLLHIRLIVPDLISQLVKSARLKFHWLDELLPLASTTTVLLFRMVGLLDASPHAAPSKGYRNTLALPFVLF